MDRLEKPSPDFARVQTRAVQELGTTLSYKRIDVRDVDAMNAIVQEIADKHQRLDGLVAAAGIQQETPALEYTAADCDKMLGVNVTGVFMTAQAAAKQMIRFGNGGSIVLIASMSGTIANRVCLPLAPPLHPRVPIPSIHVNSRRDLFARPTMPPRPLCSSWVETSPANGASMASA
jgi:NAD(P)-dependent dehydrogenase (short-subunit alcohol dehydrogenase family)